MTTLIPQKLFGTYDPRPGAGSLAATSIALLEEQKKTWPQLSQGYEGLSSVRVRDLSCHGFSVRLQYNPARIVSSGAKVDPQSIKERRCFLCVENLPVEQNGILYREKFLVLCNPAPIFARHYTISSVTHIPQELGSSLEIFLLLAKDLSPDFTVFYNGPKCGASAPDHLHFQASPAATIPVEIDVCANDRRILLKRGSGVSYWGLKAYGREVLLVESSDLKELESALVKIIKTLRIVIATSEEPMMNILCSYGDAMWRVIIFPRRKHRPDVYFLEGEASVLVSPASVDIGGLVVTPVEKDFLRIDARLIEDIFQEVTIGHDVMEKMTSLL